MREGEINKACWLPDIIIIIGQSCAVLWALMSVFIFVLGRPEWANVARGFVQEFGNPNEKKK